MARKAVNKLVETAETTPVVEKSVKVKMLTTYISTGIILRAGEEKEIDGSLAQILIAHKDAERV